MNSRCPKHDCEHEKLDVGRGKWIPICPQCEAERKAALNSAFAPASPPLPYGPILPFHAACGVHHEEGSCPCGSPRKEYNDGDTWLV